MSAQAEPPSDGSATRVLVVIPTYNEAENIGVIVARLRAAVPAVDVLVVDDSSPDGTGELADRLASADPQVHAVHRSVKQGLGAAYLEGFAWAFAHGYEAVCEMDADGSHQPEQLPPLIAALADPTVALALGSRWVPGGSVVNWPWHRLLLSRGGSLYARIALGLGVKDVTGGYRVYRSEVLRPLVADGVQSEGYCFQIDLLRRVVSSGGTVVEIPITFVERVRGESKMSRRIVQEAMVRVTVWGAERAVAAVRGQRSGKAPVALYRRARTRR